MARTPSCWFAGFLFVASGLCPGGEDGSPEALKARYVEQLRSKLPAERAAAANQLGHLGAKETAPQVTALLGDEDEQVRYFAIGALLELGAVSAAESIEPFLDHPNASFRLLAADALLAFEREESLPRILDLLAKSPREPSAMLAQRVMLAGVEAAAPTYESLIDAKEKPKRLLGILLLGNLELRAFEAKLGALLDDPDADVRQAALLAAGLCDPAKHAQRLREMLRSGGPGDPAIQILARIQDPAAWAAFWRDGEPAPEFYLWANYYSAPEACGRLRRVRKPLYAFWHVKLSELLDLVSRAAGVPVKIAESVRDDVEKAQFGPNLGFLGPRPDLFSVLSVLNGYFLTGVDPRTKLGWIAEKDAIRVVAHEDARKHWKTFDAGLRAQWLDETLWEESAGREIRDTEVHSFTLAGRLDLTSELRFELSVTRTDGPVRITIEAGAEGGALAACGVLDVRSIGVQRLLIPASRFRPGRDTVSLRVEGESAKAGLRIISTGLYRHWPEPPPVSDEELLDDTEWRACRYLFDQKLESGLPRDVLGSEEASLGAAGFALTAMSILAERAGTTPRWRVSRDAAGRRAEQILDHVLSIESRQTPEGNEWGIHGFPYHFLDAHGRRAHDSEVSTADFALFLAGALEAGMFFGGPIREKADLILHAADFKRFFNAKTARYSHGWRPGTGLLPVEWDRPGDEALLVTVLALAQDPADRDRLRACYAYPRVSESFDGVPVVRSYTGALFTYTFAHFWIPFERLGKDRPDVAGAPVPAVDWWVNSRNAVEANRRYHTSRLKDFPALCNDDWGASSCYRADSMQYHASNSAPPSELGAGFDGTVPPHGAVMSIFLAAGDGTRLAENPSMRSLRQFYEKRFATLWGSYGPRSSFDANGNVSPVVVGIEKGPEALGIEAHRTGGPARRFASHPAVLEALKRVFERAP